MWVSQAVHCPAGFPPLLTKVIRATLASLESVDYVAISETTSAIEAIKLLRPDVFVKGSDYVDPDEDITGNIVEESTSRRVGENYVKLYEDVLAKSRAAAA